MKTKTKNIGIHGIDSPSDVCTDINCPFHGKLSIRGRLFTGTVSKKKNARYGTVEWERRLFIPKYERFEKRRSKVQVHMPECLHIHKDDKIIIGECRPISKVVKFVALQKVEGKK